MIRRAQWREAVAPAAAPDAQGWRLVGPSGVVAAHVEMATSPWRRTVGLLGRDGIEPGHALLLTPCAQVHTIGMRFAIDAVFCDESLTVLTAQTLPPHRLGKAVRGAKCCIELPEGAAAAAGITAGTVLRFEGPPTGPVTA